MEDDEQNREPEPPGHGCGLGGGGQILQMGRQAPTDGGGVGEGGPGTDGRLYPWGNDPPTPLHANYGKKEWNNHEALVPVGTLEAGKSPYGIYDMAGNVWEWVSDWYDNDYYKHSPAESPAGPPTGGFKVIRGGSWNTSARNLRAADRYFDPPVVPKPIRPRVPVREDSIVLG